MSFKVISWNILADAYIKTSYYPNVPPEALEPAGRRARLLDTLEAQQADLYLLQEVEPDAFQAITARLGAGFEAHLAQKPGRPEGVALLARRSAVTIQQRETLVYEARNNGAPVALLALLQIEGRALAVASTHLEWSPDDTPAHAHTGRRQLAELLAQRGRFAPAGTPWLLGGDLNATSQSPPLELAYAEGMQLSCRAQRPWDTCNFHRRCRKLDYLLITPGALHPSPGRLPRLTADTPMPSLSWPSDHLAVEVTYTWEAAR
jgi:endonuclease/exonuclease/phosphatase family metal-dependent hydrolase